MAKDFGKNNELFYAYFILILKTILIEVVKIISYVA